MQSKTGLNKKQSIKRTNFINFVNIHNPNIPPVIHDKCIKMFTDTIKNINDEQTLKDTLDNFETPENMQHMIFTYINESKTQRTSKIHDELELQKTLREEEERKKTQDERTIDNLINVIKNKNNMMKD